MLYNIDYVPMRVDILGVEIDNVNLTDALVRIEKWIWNSGRHYIVTPNLEIILAAQKDPEFKKILNDADLAIPDSSSLGFSYWLLKRNILERLLLWPLFFIPLKQMTQFERVSGTDLMETLCKLATEKGFTTAFLGGKHGVANKASECLKKKYPGLKVVFADSAGKVNREGEMSSGADLKIPPADILFVAFGHVKQEKWIAKNLNKLPVHVIMGVGGAFDYLSGNIPRAPGWLRALGLEWLFRLIMQPWRIGRQLALSEYLWLLVTR